MKLKPISRLDLHQKLSQGTVVITGNSRLASALHQEYQQKSIDNGKLVWETPAIKPWSIWLNQCWEVAVFDGLIEPAALLLTDIQEQHVWESIIADSTESILRTEATAKKVSAAWSQLINWQVKRDDVDFEINEDTRAFQKWADEFERQCDEQGWLTASRMAEQCIQCISENPAAFNSEYILLGFDELTPLQQAMTAAMSDTAGSVSWMQLAEESTVSRKVGRLACADNDDEIRSLVRWTRSRLQQQPEARIGIVVPDLAAHRSVLVRCLTESLLPANLMAGRIAELNAPLPWNISLGLPLKQYPLIETAFNILELVAGNFATEDIGPLLTSPYLAGAAAEFGSRGLLDRKLRDIGEQKVSLKSLSLLAGQSEKAWFCPLFAGRVETLIELSKNIPGSTNPAGWVKWFAEILAAAGWTKDRDYGADEYQTIESFHKLLARFSGLQSVCGRITYSRALSLLKRLALSQIFQPRTEATPIQILGMYEAIGMNFDFLWVMDLHDNNWPASPQANPFIPFALQRELAMPHADQSRELAIAQGITSRLLSSAAEVVMSYPLRNGEEPLRLSPLIRGLEECDKASLDLSNEATWSSVIQKSGLDELLIDDAAPALEQQRASGGSGIFKYQSLCPFRAFAQYRLSATALATAQPGLDAMKRGQLFHAVLELFWRDVRDLKTLLSINDDSLANKLDGIIAQAIDQMARQNPEIFSPKFRKIESSRLKNLTQQWLEIEKLRADFKVVDFEKEVWHEINGINVHLWIDRIDELADGRKLVIDYKTGTVNPSQWFGDRPEEPQLPLYSIAEGSSDVNGGVNGNGAVSAVLFGQLKAADMKFNGVVEEEGLIPNLPSSRNALLKEATELWPQVLSDWQQTIQKLAEDFRDGKADVDPKKPSTCETSYCELSGLCRIDEQNAAIKSGPGSRPGSIDDE